MLASAPPTDQTRGLFETFNFQRANASLYSQQAELVIIPSATVWNPAVERETGLDLPSFIQNTLSKFFKLWSNSKILSSTISDNTVVEESLATFEFRERCQSVAKGFKPNGKSATVWMFTYMRFQKRKIVEMRILWDHASLLFQLGLLSKAPHPEVEQAIELPLSDRTWLSAFSSQGRNSVEMIRESFNEDVEQVEEAFKGTNLNRDANFQEDSFRSETTERNPPVSQEFATNKYGHGMAIPSGEDMPIRPSTRVNAPGGTGGRSTFLDNFQAAPASRPNTRGHGPVGSDIFSTESELPLPHHQIRDNRPSSHIFDSTAAETPHYYSHPGSVRNRTSHIFDSPTKDVPQETMHRAHPSSLINRTSHIFEPEVTSKALPRCHPSSLRNSESHIFDQKVEPTLVGGIPINPRRYQSADLFPEEPATTSSLANIGRANANDRESFQTYGRVKQPPGGGSSGFRFG